MTPLRTWAESSPGASQPPFPRLCCPPPSPPSPSGSCTQARTWRACTGEREDASLLYVQTFRRLPPRAWLKCFRFYLIFFCASSIMNVAHYLRMTDNLEGKKQRKGDTQDCYCLIRRRQSRSISTTLIPSWVLELHGQNWISTEINLHFKKTLKGLSGSWWAFPSVRKEERLWKMLKQNLFFPLRLAPTFPDTFTTER